MRFAQKTVAALILSSALGGVGVAAAFCGPSSVGRRATFSPRSPASTVAVGIRSRGLPSAASRLDRSRLRSSDEDEDEDHDDDEDDGYDEDEDPLGDGIESVSWLPSALITAKSSGDAIAGSSVGKGAEVLPLFPLGGIVYTPNSEHVLNIFEPRYRQMYNDILMNGTKRFVVAMSHPTEEGSFAATGVLFRLEDLKEVSEQTNDQVKYICNHKVTGRVKLHRILNPEVWESRDSYLRVEGTIIDDSDGAADADSNEGEGEGGDEQKVAATEEPKKDEEVSVDVYSSMSGALGKLGIPTSDEERALRAAFEKMVDLQHQLQEDVRFTRASIDTLAVAEGAGEGSLWNTIRLWQSYAEQRLVARQNDMQREFQEKLLEFLMRERGIKEEDVPSAIGFQDLSPELQAEVQELQRRMAVDLQPLVLESTLTMQKILECEDHTERVNLLRHFMDAERKRLEARKVLQGMFTGVEGTVMDEEPMGSGKTAGVIEKAMESSNDDDEEEDEDEGEEEDGPPSQPSSIFMDDEDAFQ